MNREEAVLYPEQVLIPDSMLNTPRPDNLEELNQALGNQMFHSSPDVEETNEQGGMFPSSDSDTCDAPQDQETEIRPIDLSPVNINTKKIGSY